MNASFEKKKKKNWLIMKTKCGFEYIPNTVLSLLNAPGALQFFKRGMFIIEANFQCKNAVFKLIYNDTP